MPPSPWLSARVIRVTYLRVTTSISAQNTTETAPTMVSWFSGTPVEGPKMLLMV